ncbi:MAG: type I glyceraldehyde-3-phosphate dehydrogenase [Micromonosporaceae bacterium]|jgi:glyceraldehyde 3-phosphate dehydrogenase
MPARVAINGLGRIGRATLKAVLGEPALELVAVNDIAPTDNLAYLLRYDTVYGRMDQEVTSQDATLSVGDRSVRVLNEQDPAALPWGDLAVDLVFECTGKFRTAEDARKHLQAGARRVVLSAPAKDDLTTTVFGVNQNAGQGEELVSTASCTTNCIAPVVEILDRRIGVRKATMTTVHAYTSSQHLVDGPARQWRRGRAGAANIVPTSTGAAEATAKTVPSIQGRFDGVALRVPVPVGSLADVVCVTSRPTSVEEVNDIFREEAAGDRYGDVVAVSEDPLVSSDIIADPRAAVIDADLTTVTDGDLVKVMAWYDNEWGYARQMVRYAVAAVGQPVGAGG